MVSGRCCWSLGSLLLLLGRNLGVDIKIHQDSVNGTVGQSVLLPVSYRFDGASGFPVSIHWTFRNSNMLITGTVENCSVDAEGAPSNCSANTLPHLTYQRRAKLFPENGSLLLRDLQLDDSGVYSVIFRPPQQTRHITLTVHEQRFPPEPPNAEAPGHVLYSAVGICSAISLLLLFLLFYCVRHRGAAGQQQRRIIKQQQVSSVEESHMGSAAVRAVETVYARIGDSLGQSRPRPAPEVVYASVTAPGLPGLDAGRCHLRT